MFLKALSTATVVVAISVLFQPDIQIQALGFVYLTIGFPFMARAYLGY